MAIFISGCMHIYPALAGLADYKVFKFARSCHFRNYEVGTLQVNVPRVPQGGPFVSVIISIFGLGNRTSLLQWLCWNQEVALEFKIGTHSRVLMFLARF